MKRVLLFLSLVLFECNGNVNLDYKDIDNNKFIRWKEIFNHTESGYFYIFSYTCPNCEEIKSEVLQFLINQDNYFLIPKDDDMRFSSNEKSSLGASSIENLAIRGFPTLIHLESYIVDDIITGKTKILEHIKNSSIL